MEGDIRILRFPQKQTPHLQKPGVWLWLLRRLPLLAGCDVVHIHGQTALLAWYLPFRLLLPGKPVFITFHGHPGVFPLGRRHRFERRLAEKLTRDNICVGHYLEKWYGTRAAAVTYGAAGPPREAGAPEDRTISFVGRLEKDTGILLYLQALSIIREKTGERWKLTVCGDGALRNRVRDFIREQGLDADLLGTVSDPMPRVWKSRFVFASGYLALLEAMVCRRLVFAVYENPLKRDYLEMMPGAREMMVISGSAEELAASFLQVLQEPVREAAYVERAHRFAEEQTWGRVAETYLSLYGSRGVK
jgi:glycosyltransferase involved in cell wall biosynthesis